MIKIKWHGELFPETMRTVEKRVIEDIEYNLQDIDRPSSLIFHTVLLGNEDWSSSPGVIVWGEEGDDEFYHCEYHENLKFESLDVDN